jgi:hypothetical protein
MFKQILIGIVFLASTSVVPSAIAAGVEASPRILSAYQDSSGMLVLEMSTHEFPSGNVFFVGNSQKLKQLEVTWDNANQDERDITFASPSGSMSKTDVSDLVIHANEARISSGQKSRTLKKASPAELALVEKRVNSGSLRLARLPQVLRSAFLFQVQATGEYVLVREPVYDFHGNYEVSVGRKGHLKKIAVLAPDDWKNGPRGEIRFKSGGGLYIPKLAHLLVTVSTQIEPPTLIRSKAGHAETLVLPKLNGNDLAQFGFAPSGDLAARSVSSRRITKSTSSSLER